MYGSGGIFDEEGQKGQQEGQTEKEEATFDSSSETDCKSDCVSGEDGNQVVSVGETGNQTEGKTIQVFVCGAVRSPGVYELPEDSRVNLAIDAAGGFREDANKNYWNLAAVLKDTDKIYVPTMSEKVEVLPTETSSVGVSAFPININKATAEQLMTLPGIGEAKAKAIVAYRNEHGAFQKNKDLMKVTGIGEKMYSQLSEYITVEE